MSNPQASGITDFVKFRALLESEMMFPTTYIHKFIGRETEKFLASVRAFEGKFVGLKRTQERTSASGGFLALTYSFIAGTPDDVIELTRETQAIEDLLYIL